MIRQITLIKFKRDTGGAEIGALGDGFRKLAGVVPGIRRFEFGSDLELESGTLDYALVIDFASVEDWKAYREHPDHIAFAETVLPRIERVERVQYALRTP